jgi:CRISPR system Cascade subunit CasD
MANTLYLRLESSLQAWGDESRFNFRRTRTEPTKSGVAGLLCACLGVSRESARPVLARLAATRFGVREDRPGKVIMDYQTVGSRTGGTIAELNTQGRPKSRPTADETVREYLADASFLAVVQGDPALVAELAAAVKNPVFVPYLGRRCCTPTTALFGGLGEGGSVSAALADFPVRLRPGHLQTRFRCVADASGAGPVSVRNDVAVDLVAHTFAPRAVQEFWVEPPVCETEPELHAKSGRSGAHWLKIRLERLEHDWWSCVACGERAVDVHHVTYARHGNERASDLRSVCKPCHEVLTALEYEAAMGQQRIDPLDPMWRVRILGRRPLFVKQ